MFESNLPNPGNKGKLHLNELAKIVHCSRTTLVQAIKKIEVEGVFKVETQGRHGTQVLRLK
jgi:DNA-binding GntR family transcriptional regulator